MSDDESTAEKAKGVLVFFLACVAMVIGMAAVAYILTIGFDKYCTIFRNEDDVGLTQEEVTERRNAGTLIKRSGLAGILPEERARVIRHFFAERTMKYTSISNMNTDELTGENNVKPLRGNVTEQQEEEEENTTTTMVKKKLRSTPKPISSIERSPTNDLDAQTMNTPETVVEDDIENQELEELCDLEHDEGTCPICLNEYQENDNIITGTACSHIFHMECCMQWLEKGNDHCAYCRKLMLRPDEFLQSAREELGEDRVNKILRINEAAARRLREYESARAAWESSADHVERNSPESMSNGDNNGADRVPPTDASGAALEVSSASIVVAPSGDDNVPPEGNTNNETQQATKNNNNEEEV